MTDLTEQTAGIRALIPLFDYMGFELVEAGNGRAAGRIPLGPNGNHFGVIYAGALFSVADGKEGVASFLEKRDPAFTSSAGNLPDVFPS